MKPRRKTGARCGLIPSCHPAGLLWEAEAPGLVRVAILVLIGGLSGFTCNSGVARMTEMGAQDFKSQREQMVRHQLQARDIDNPRILDAMRDVPRHRFVPASQISQAYDDHPLPIGKDQTISQPYIVALMTQLVHPGKSSKTLEVGTGSGYQAAVLAELVDQVYTIEIVPGLAERAATLLSELGVENVHVRQGDGYQGWPEQAPFDCILVTAAPREVPPPLLQQLAIGGRLVIPVGVSSLTQTLLVIERTKRGFKRTSVIPVRFVPMTGEAQRQKVP